MADEILKNPGRQWLFAKEFPAVLVALETVPAATRGYHPCKRSGYKRLYLRRPRSGRPLPRLPFLDQIVRR